jgi:hypothetical protein
VNKLGIIAAGGIGLAIVCAFAAASMGVGRIADNMDFTWFDGPACAATGATAASRSLAWDGSDSISVRIPANIHYRPTNGQGLEVRGDPMILSHLRVKDGHIDLDCHMRHWRGRRVDITLPGRAFREYHIAGLADMDLQDIDQDALKISIAGKTTVTASGKVGALKLDIAGKGDAHMKDLMVQNLEIDIAGRGDIEASPIADADISIAGSGDVALYTEPRRISTSIMGSGNIRHLAGQD